MNIGELRKLIAELPDRVPVVVPGPDHSFTLAHSETVVATRTGPRTFVEHDPDDFAPSDANTAVLVIS